jgi:transposase
MKQMDQISEVRLSLARGESMRSVSARCQMSRNTVSKIARTGLTEFTYKRREPAHPVLGPYLERLEQILSAEQDKPKKNRRTLLQIYELLQLDGYLGSYDAVRRYAKKSKEERPSLANAFVPLVFQKGEAFQFDWSEEHVELGGVLTKVYVSQFRLCYSRMRFCLASTRMNLEFLFAAHVAAHNFFKGLCGIGIYDNPKTIVTKVGKGKERVFNRRFLQLSSHYLFDPRACTPAAGWEKGQVESQVKTNRQRVFIPRLCFASIEELNAHLSDMMIREAHNSQHPEFSDKSVWQMYEEEKPFLRVQQEAFDGYMSNERRANTQCLVQYDSNYYSLPCVYAHRPVTVRAYADRIAILFKGKTVAEHRRELGKERYILDPLHYVPLLSRKPGALRNGRPFLEWELPASIQSVWDSLKRFPDWDRQMAAILSAIPEYGIEAVAVACEIALEQGTVSQVVILNYLARLHDAPPVPSVAPPEKFILSLPPQADCTRYDRLLRRGVCYANGS